MDDVGRLRAVLAPFEREAAELPWAHRRRWRAATHVRAEKRLPTVDLHDLDVHLGRRVVRAIAEEATELEAGGVRLITGWGRHAGGVSRLRRAVGDELNALCRENGWGFRPGNRGTWILVTDGSLFVPEDRGELGLVVWLVGALLVVGVWLVAPPIGLALGLWMIWRLFRRFRGRTRR